MRRRRHELESDGLSWVSWGPRGRNPEALAPKCIGIPLRAPRMHCGCRPDWGAIVHLQRWRYTSCRNRVVLQQ